ncbi:hypothetical protein [Flavobacterium quisquiliarum]|jgi:hypothetical protein|uniref:Uncharacterized protein n=2 Tax=Flavobacterium TaxID=237 RepID=A0ABV8WBR9_9FLAO|nr:hypothetical protein [Flavobacterium quisquiliarum]MBW1656762.1 hypothetical protein [Flavobacterium quisquiliarum]NWL00388.1 hypothetical protein [Flavobacterium collinsii]
MKLDAGAHNAKMDFKKMQNVMRNLPDNGSELKNYIISTPLLKAVKTKVDEIYEAKIFFKDLRTGKEYNELPSTFRQKIKLSYDQINDFQKIDPEVLNTSKDELIESSYQSVKNKLK